ncbi:OmpA family protein [Desulfococcaceae bacterium HSG8]|nr:OmpA family protein [Desulfococcaceae bacterium HSG8]
MKTRLFYYLFLILVLGISARTWAEDAPLRFPETREKITEAFSNTDTQHRLGDDKGLVPDKGLPSGIENDAPRVGALIRFDFDSDSVRSDSYPLLREFGESFQNDLPDAIFLIEGHADNTGEDKYNKKLSRRRARAVKKFLISEFQIDKKRLRIKAYGEKRPVASNETEEGRALNRRVEFVRIK